MARTSWLCFTFSENKEETETSSPILSLEVFRQLAIAFFLSLGRTGIAGIRTDAHLDKKNGKSIPR
jgi:hypothetical protein